MGGVMAVPSGLRDVGRSMRLSPADILWKIVLPAAAPSVVVGCRLSMSISLVLAIVVEMIGNPQGLGYAAELQRPGCLWPPRSNGFRRLFSGRDVRNA
jgi:ABC-type nitrate/sulfonate/bicarbonate transport system permease component